jgi:hypothetical protein
MSKESIVLSKKVLSMVNALKANKREYQRIILEIEKIIESHFKRVFG